MLGQCQAHCFGMSCRASDSGVYNSDKHFSYIEIEWTSLCWFSPTSLHQATTSSYLPSPIKKVSESKPWVSLARLFALYSTYEIPIKRCIYLPDLLTYMYIFHCYLLVE